MSMTVLGISCYFHDASACIIRDGRVLAAAQEERFNRDKHSPVFPIQAINYCLSHANITAHDLQAVAFYEKPYLKFERTILGHIQGFPGTLRNFLDMMPLWLRDRLSLPLTLEDELGYRGPLYFVPHHLAHAASAFYSSPFDESAFLVFDGVGEKTTTSFGLGRDRKIEILGEQQYPHSLGLLYSIITAYLGFRVYSGEGKVMALAEYGKPTFREAFDKMIEIRPDGSYRLNLEYFQLQRGDRMYGDALIRLLGAPRPEGAPIESRHQDIAASLQSVVEEVILKTANHLHAKTGLSRLCLAGGVFLNVTVNSRLIRESPFKDVYIQPAAGDAGAALGAAAYITHDLKEIERPADGLMNHAFLGPEHSPAQIKRALLLLNLPVNELSEDQLLVKTAEAVAQGKVVGWFQGRMEFGPRALGSRSILATPARADMKDTLNSKVKHRESFRPFGLSILNEDVPEYFDWEVESPFMLFVASVRKEKKAQIPSGVHVNDTSRLQTVTEARDGRYYRLIREFKKQTGLPMVINTSFNDNNEPIVCTPEDACRCYLKTGMDALAIGNYFLEKHK